MNLKQIFVIAIIAMFLIVPFASAKQESVDVAKDTKQDKKIEEKAVDKTKEQPKEVKNKDKEITGKITVTDTDVSKYSISKDGDAAIKIKKDGEHTKAKVTIPKEELQKIDKDGDKLYGVLHIADDGTATHDVVTESELVAGTEMTFSTNVVNGYAGYKEYQFSNVVSGQTLNIDDMSGSNYYVTCEVDGVVPTYTAGIPTDGLWAHYSFEGNANDSSGNNHHGTPFNITYSNGAAVFKNSSTLINLPTPDINSSFTIVADANISPSVYGLYFIWGNVWSTSGIEFSNDACLVADLDTHPRGFWGKPVVGTRNTYTMVYNSTNVYRYNKLVKEFSDSTSGVPYIGSVVGTAHIGGGNTVTNKIYDMQIYSKSLNISSISQAYAGASGISFKPNPSYNFTGYNVASGVEKVLNTDSTCTGIEYVDTTGGTHTVTVRVYFSEDITKTTETKGAVYQNVSIVHTKQNATASVGTIAYELDPLYSGTPVLSSNNTNATVSRNDTHAIISTGLVKQGQSFSYAVSVPDNHDHIIFLNKLMKWMGSGWDYVGVAPEDWTDAITDIKVIVS